LRLVGRTGAIRTADDDGHVAGRSRRPGNIHELDGREITVAIQIHVSEDVVDRAAGTDPADFP